jgi:hypothetical protein
MPRFKKFGISSQHRPSFRRRTRDKVQTLHVTYASDVRVFSPDDLDSLVFWLKADAGVTKTENRLSAWASQTGSYSVEQATGSKQPLYVASQINSLPIIRFLTNDFMVKTSSLFDGDSPLTMTMAAVLKIKAAAAASDDTQYAISLGGAETQGVNSLTWTGKADDALATFKLNSSKLSPTSVVGEDVAVDTAKLLMWEVYANGECNLWVDRDLVTSTTVAADGTLGGVLRVGGFGAGAPDMDLGELCVWQGTIPRPDKQNFFSYIKTRWGIL